MGNSPLGLPIRMFGTWLHNALAQSGLNQAELARELSRSLGRSIGRGTINKLINGTRRMSADELLEIARVCRVPLPISTSKTDGDSQSNFMVSFSHFALKHFLVGQLARANIPDAEKHANAVIATMIRDSIVIESKPDLQTRKSISNLELLSAAYKHASTSLDEAFTELASISVDQVLSDAVSSPRTKAMIETLRIAIKAKRVLDIQAGVSEHISDLDLLRVVGDVSPKRISKKVDHNKG